MGKLRPLSLSIVQLLSRADDFDGRFVQVCGFYRHEFEGTALYLHRGDFEHGLTKNAIWVEDGDATFNLQHVLVEGYFDAKSNGHFDLFSGTIRDVQRMVALPTRRMTED